MKIRNTILSLSLTLTMFAGCGTSNEDVVRCSLFFNPSQAFYSDQVHFVAKVNDSLILDSLVKNKRVDNSELMKCIHLEKRRKQILTLIVSGKEKRIDLKTTGQKCLNVFVRLDDHSSLDLKQDEIEKKNMALGNSKIDVHKIWDSLRLNSKKNEYDSISVNVKNDRCICE